MEVGSGSGRQCHKNFNVEVPFAGLDLHFACSCINTVLLVFLVLFISLTVRFILSCCLCVSLSSYATVNVPSTSAPPPVGHPSKSASASHFHQNIRFEQLSWSDFTTTSPPRISHRR